MIKLVRYLAMIGLVLFSAVLNSANVPTAKNPFGIEISIGSVGQRIDLDAYTKLSQTIGNNVSSNVIDKFLIYGYGYQAGFSGCVEAAPGLVPGIDFTKLLNDLNAIQPKADTVYSVKRILTCPNLLPALPSTLPTAQVAKPDGSLTCKPGSGISLSAMQKQLGNIVVYSYHKLPDGLTPPAVCDSPTGTNNVYEIAAADLTKAMALGFLDWRKVTPFPLTTGVKTAMAIAVKYQCITKTVRGTNFCYKYRISPLPVKLIATPVGTCPNKPPSNCP